MDISLDTTNATVTEIKEAIFILLCWLKTKEAEAAKVVAEDAPRQKMLDKVVREAAEAVGAAALAPSARREDGQDG